MGLSDSLKNYSGVRVKSYSSLTRQEQYEIGSCDGLIDSIKLLREKLGRNAENSRGLLAEDKLHCEQLRGEVLMGRLKV